VLPANREIWELLQLTSTQWRTTTDLAAVAHPAGGIHVESRTRYLGIDHNAVLAAAPALEVPITRTFLIKLKEFETAVLKIALGKNPSGKAAPEPCTEDQREECRILYGDLFARTCEICPSREPQNG
jgi:hypothetical protein